MSDIRTWLAGLGLQKYADVFAANDIDLASIGLMSDADFEKLGVTLGHRRRLLKAAATLVDQVVPAKLAAPTAAGTERRQLTIMFCDLVGSTELSARLDPEEMREVIGTYHRTCSKVIELCHGYVAKYMGDGILAYFGYPMARENAADLAVLAGLRIVEAVAKFDAKAFPDLKSELAVRVGIATGEVVVGDQIGVESSREWSVVGDTPNLAARLQAAAKPGHVLVGDRTRRLTRQQFDWSGPEELSLKGFEEPVRAWRVRGESAPKPFGHTASAEKAHLIGRHSELSLLGDRLELARSGQGQAILLIGEAGIGKSAITRALIERARSDDVTCILLNCSPFHQSSELKPFSIEIERQAGIVRDDPPAENFARLRTWLGRTRNDTDITVALFAELLSLTGISNGLLTDITPRAQRAKTLDILEAQILELERRGPVLLGLEDAHWIDPTSGELLDRLVDRIRRSRMTIFVNARPEFEANWTRRPNVTLLTLNRLGRREAAAVVAEVAGPRELHPELVDQLLARAEGNPLFLQELSKSVLEALEERGSEPTRQLTEKIVHLIPATLRDSLTERLDRLGAGKQAAQAAAVIGQEFDERLLAAIMHGPEAQLRENLNQLIEAEIIVARGSDTPTAYSFRHALIQEAAYQSLLKANRRDYHRRIAESVEGGVIPGLSDREPERIAQHFAEAGIADRAIEFWRRAGVYAARRSADREAVKQLNQALDLLRRQPDGPDRAGKELSILIALGPVLMATDGWNADKVREVYDAAMNLARETGRSAEMFPVLWGRWLIAHAGGAASSALKLLQQLSDVVQNSDNPDLMMQFHHAAASNHCSEGAFAHAVEQAEACLAGYQFQQHQHQAMQYGGHDPCVCTTCVGALAQFSLGRAVRAQDWSDRALTLAGKVEHVPSIAHAHVYRAELGQIRGEPALVMKSAEHALTVGLDKGLAHYVAWAKIMRGWARTMGGETEKGLGEMEEGYMELQKVGIRYHLPHRLGVRAQTYAVAGRPSDAIAAIEEALASVKQTGEIWYEAELLRMNAGLVRLAFPADRGIAESLLEQAIAVASKQGARQWESRARIDLAKLFAEQSRESVARDILAPTRNWNEIDLPERTYSAKLMSQLSR